MTKQLRRGLEWTLAAAIIAAIAACGSATTEPAVSGVALSDSPIAGRVSIADSSAEAQRRTVTTGEDGSFSLDVSGLTPPYEVAVEWEADGSTQKLLAIADRETSLDVNPITDTVFAAASADDDDDRSEAEERLEISRRAPGVLMQLQTVLAPLFERYGITNIYTDRAAVQALLEDVSVRRDDGVVTVVNRETRLVIFRGSIRNLSAGTFYPENMPAGPGTPPPASNSRALSRSPSSRTSSTGFACSFASARSLCVISIEQNRGPHIEQKCAFLAPSAGSVASWYRCAVSGSIASAN
jgi:hypothetical protein